MAIARHRAMLEESLEGRAEAYFADWAFTSVGVAELLPDWTGGSNIIIQLFSSMRHKRDPDGDNAKASIDFVDFNELVLQ